METRKRIEIAGLGLPDELIRWAGGAPVYESSGQSGARTVYIERSGGVYLKIAASGSLSRAACMQAYFADKKMSPSVIRYITSDRDYLLTEPLVGEDGTSEKYLSEPKRLSEIFGTSLRTLHEIDTAGCPVTDKMCELVSASKNAAFLQSHLDAVSGYIEATCADAAASEIKLKSAVLKNDVLIHGDYCLPNIILNNWKFAGFIDVADGGIGDRHYDLAWWLWTLNWNLKTPKYGQSFLEAYGLDIIDRDRLSVCGLLAAMD